MKKSTAKAELCQSGQIAAFRQIPERDLHEIGAEITVERSDDRRGEGRRSFAGDLNAEQDPVKDVVQSAGDHLKDRLLRNIAVPSHDHDAENEYDQSC